MRGRPCVSSFWTRCHEKLVIRQLLVQIFIQNEDIVDLDTKVKKALPRHVFQRYEPLDKADRSDGKTYET